jgi:hypothetical protein
MDLWKNLVNIFKGALQSSPANPLYHESIIRTNNQLTQFENWKGTHSRAQMINFLAEEYHQFKHKLSENDEAITFVNCGTMKGFVLSYDAQRWSEQEFINLFDLLRDRVAELGYVKYMSDQKDTNRGSVVETLHRHYLKPPLAQNESQQFIQQYGNVMICMVARNGKLIDMKFSTTAYSGRTYTAPKDVDELMSHVFKLNG